MNLDDKLKEIEQRAERAKSAKKFYHSVHNWLSYYHGKANKCEGLNCRKNSQRFHWAKKKGCRYARKRENFFMLCASCHTIYDMKESTRRNMSKIAKLNRLSPESRRKQAESMKLAWARNPFYGKRVAQISFDGEVVKEFPSMAAAAREVGLHLSCISAVCRNSRYNKSAAGYFWRFV